MSHVSVHSIGTATGQNHQGTLLLMCAIPDDLMLTDGSRALTLVSVRNKALLWLCHGFFHTSTLTPQ